MAFNKASKTVLNPHSNIKEMVSHNKILSVNGNEVDIPTQWMSVAE